MSSITTATVMGKVNGLVRERRSDVARPARVPEAFVSWVWQGQRLARELHTSDGRPVQVVYPGWRCGSAGPDFHSALLSIDHQLVRGDVELHVRARDWHVHGHGTDPAYAQTVLHVVFEEGISLPIVRSDGEIVPTVALAGALSDPLELLLMRWEAEPTAGPPSPRCLAPEEAGPILERAGLARFRGKVDRFEGDLSAVSPAQALWAGLLESLGYSANVAPMRRLAERVPIEEAACILRLDGVEALEATLLGESGLLPSQRGRLPLDDVSIDRERCWSVLSTSWSSGEAWRWVGVRPANGPVRRVACAAHLASRVASGALTDAMCAILPGPDPRRTHRKLRALIECPGEPYWREHFDFGRPLRRPSALLGAGRAAEAVVNVLLPWAAAIGRTSDDRELVNTAEAAYLAHPRLGVNQIVRHMAEQIIGPGPQAVIAGACQQQGLIHIYRGWCDARNCATCPAGGQS